MLTPMRDSQVPSIALPLKSEAIAHALRGPLNVILGHAQLMESALPPPTDSQKESLAQILQAGWDQLRLIQEMLDPAATDSPDAAIFCGPPVSVGASERTLLYIEDNESNLNLVEQLISTRSDIRLMSAVEGSIGVELARVMQPTVILMDINLPGISGIEALRFLHEDPATAHIPVIALSANGMRLDIEMGLGAGFFAYLTKPVRIQEFMDTLNSALRFAEENHGPLGRHS